MCYYQSDKILAQGRAMSESYYYAGRDSFHTSGGGSIEFADSKGNVVNMNDHRCRRGGSGSGRPFWNGVGCIVDDKRIEFGSIKWYVQ